MAAAAAISLPREFALACAMYDEACELVRERIPPDLAQRRADMWAKGGPAPTPAGEKPPEQLAAEASAAATAGALVLVCVWLLV